MCDQVKHRSKAGDYLSVLKNHPKILKSDINIYKDELNSINSKLSMPRSIFKRDR